MDRDRALVTAFLLLLLFTTPLAHLWAAAAGIWYLPYLLWGGVLLPLLLPGFPRGRS